MLASVSCRLSCARCIKSSSRPVLALATVEAHQRRNFRVRPKPMWSSDFQEMPPKLSPELQNAKLAIFGGDFIPSPEDTKDIVQAFQINKEASSAESASQLKAMRSEYAKLGEQIASEEKRYVELLAAERRSMLAYEEKQYVKIAKFRETTFMEKILSSEDTMDIVETLQRDKQTSTATATFPSPLKEYSVIYTDRAMNLMAAPFTKHMQELSSVLKDTYQADHTCFVPGAGHFAMEAVARQFATDENVMVVRNGFFSFRWSAIMEQSKIAKSISIITSLPIEDGHNPHFAPPKIEDVVAKIKTEKPAVVFAPHVETSAGILLSDEYIKSIADAVHEHGGVFVLDGIAAGTWWCDMKKLGVDVYITAPQKGWTGPACVGIAMMSDRARKISENRPPSTSMVLDLNKWLGVMDKYEEGGFMYYTTLPTDSLVTFNEVAQETVKFGRDNARTKMAELGEKIRAVMVKKGFKILAAPGYEAPGVVVVYTPDKEIAAKFKAQGVQVATGVPLMVDEPVDRMDDRFRIGLFGLDKIQDVDKTVADLEKAMDAFC